MKSTISKRLVALCMAFAMMFSLMTVVHAEDVSDGLSKPTTHTEVAKPASLGTVTMAGTTMDVYGANAQNPCMGNPYYVNRNENWTFINYFITGILPTGLSSVETTYALKSGASISGAGATNVTASTCTFDFTVGNILTVTNGSESRAYDAELAVEGQSVIVKQAEDGTRNYDINLSEVINSTYGDLSGLLCHHVVSHFP